MSRRGSVIYKSRSLIKKAVAVCAAMAFLLTVTACSQLVDRLDVVAKSSVVSFETILDALPEQAAADEGNGGWTLAAPDQTARFIWSEDWSKSPLHDVMIEFDITPFLEAGLDPAKLPENYTYYNDMMMVGRKLGDNVLQYEGTSTPLAAYKQIVNRKRDSISYHAELDHFGVALGDGNTFEWARDVDKNDKDIVFVLNPEPLIAAGVNPEAVAGWTLAKVPMMMNGKSVEVAKLLKPFDLK